MVLARHFRMRADPANDLMARPTHPTATRPRFTRLVRQFQVASRIGLALTPLVAIAYLQLFQDPGRLFLHHAFHELAIGVSTLLSVFITYVTWRCYRATGEVFQRWLVLGLVGFTLLYAPHGLFTRLSEHHMELFVIYGPLSRLVMAVCFTVAVVHSGDGLEQPGKLGTRYWRMGLLFVALALAAGWLALRLPQATALMRVVMEAGALTASVLGILGLHARRTRSPLMMAYMFALALFAASSLSFMLAAAWNHQWWLAHAIFAMGFFVLSYGITQAYLTTQSFATAYSQEQMVESLRLEKLRADQAVAELEASNARLLTMATTDALTGAANRRQYADRVDAEVARAQRKGFALALLAVDLDHFKQVNDTYGHLAGDEVLKRSVDAMREALRPSDLVARIGGEEFRILLPDTGLEEAVAIAQRIRSHVAAMVVPSDNGEIRVTVSIGCSLLVAGDMSATEEQADARLYKAKALGRNRVVWRDAPEPASGEPEPLTTGRR